MGALSDRRFSCRTDGCREQLQQLPLLCHCPPAQGPGLCSLGAVHGLGGFSSTLTAVELCLPAGYELRHHSAPSAWPRYHLSSQRPQPPHQVLLMFQTSPPEMLWGACDHDMAPYLKMSYLATLVLFYKAWGQRRIGRCKVQTLSRLLFL